MSTTAAAITTVVLVLLGLIVVVRRVRRAWATATATVDAILTPPARDGWPGRDTAALAECQQIWDLPTYNAGLDRLRQAIRDEQQKEGGQA
ncbi:hypothetical protein ACH5A3_21120 [Streptomyces echinatus]|uniref:hypothetical protein n=1 Tax=Streptomyces echinatus TaxID=67293 RepID=UPI0037A45B95